jgi:hypothetical protein
MTYPTCPVCGFDSLSRPLEPFDICPCCGTEFGYDDSALNHEELRMRWMRTGADWWSAAAVPPPNWSPTAQLLRANLLPVDLASTEGSVRLTTTFVSWRLLYPTPMATTRVA